MFLSHTISLALSREAVLWLGLSGYFHLMAPSAQHTTFKIFHNVGKSSGGSHIAIKMSLLSLSGRWLFPSLRELIKTNIFCPRRTRKQPHTNYMLCTGLTKVGKKKKKDITLTLKKLQYKGRSTVDL